MAKIVVGYNGIKGFRAATTRHGLARLLDVSYDTVRRGLKIGYASSGTEVGDYVWSISEIELEKVGGDRGKGRKNIEGFRGMKGEDGKLVR
jgi:hypothetical protein